MLIVAILRTTCSFIVPVVGTFAKISTFEVYRYFMAPWVSKRVQLLLIDLRIHYGTLESHRLAIYAKSLKKCPSYGIWGGKKTNSQLTINAQNLNFLKKI